MDKNANRPSKAHCRDGPAGYEVQELADKATVSRATVTALRGGKSCNENSIRRVAQALDVPLEALLSSD